MKIRRFSDWVGVEGICGDAGLERLKVICCWKVGRRKRVPLSRCHRDKRIRWFG